MARLFGKPGETPPVEIPADLDVEEMTETQRAELRARILARHPHLSAVETAKSEVTDEDGPASYVGA